MILNRSINHWDKSWSTYRWEVKSWWHFNGYFNFFHFVCVHKREIYTKVHFSSMLVKFIIIIFVYLRKTRDNSTRRRIKTWK